MSALGEIRAALARTIEDGTDGLAVYPFAAENLIAPAALVLDPTVISFRETFDLTGGIRPKTYLIPVQIRVSYANPPMANDALDGWVDVVTDAILDNYKLDGVVDSVDVVSVDSFGTVDFDQITYFGCNINLEILA